MLDAANQEVKNIFHEVAQATPRFLRDVESVNQQAILLKDHMDCVENDFRKMHIDDSGVVKELEELDRQRTRVKRAADALREANRWSTLVNSRQDLMEGEGNVEQLYQLILDMEQSLAYMEHMPDYEARKALLSSTKDRLEALIAPRVMELLDALPHASDAQATSSLLHLFSIFNAIGRSAVGVRYYVTWLANHIVESWEKTRGLAVSQSGHSLQQSFDATTDRILAFYRETFAFLRNQLSLQLFEGESCAPLLNGLINSLERITPSLTDSVFSSADPDTNLRRCGELLQATEEMTGRLCALLCPTGAPSELCVAVVRQLCRPLSAISEFFRLHAQYLLTEALEGLKKPFTDDQALLKDLNVFSDRVFTVLHSLLQLAVSQTRGIALSSLLEVAQELVVAFSSELTSAFEKTVVYVVREDVASGYSQASGLSSVLLLVAATGCTMLKMKKFVEEFDAALESVFAPSNLTHAGGACNNSECPFSTPRLVAHIGEAQPSTHWGTLYPLMPASDWLKPPTSQTTPAPSVLLVNRLLSVCKAAVDMATRVAMAPVHDLLAKVPKLRVWPSYPASGEARLPDLAYLPQEYITQLGQYIFNLPEQLLPFMDPGEGSADQSDGLVGCLRCSDFNVDVDHGQVKSPTERTRLTSLSSPLPPTSPPVVSRKAENSAMITAWLDWLLSGQVSEAFVKAIFEIPSPIPTNGKPIPGLTEHGAKQLATDLGW
uniref:Conserved oligomeric Golgi complex subunit 7 n=1 Tax=Mesocestoides corti TaxID=53468 RepID=A0A5K3F5C0_MESCO